jgi:very-short-patch-repair endonuclease
MAATLSLPGPVISHHTAAGLHRFPLARQVVAHVIHQHRHNPCRNIAFHRLPLDDDEVMLWSGCLQVTTPDRTALDLLATLPIDDALDLWAWVSTRKILDGADLETALDQRLGRVGTTNLRTLSRLTRGGAVSPAELLLHSILHDAGLGGWEAGVTLRDAQGVIGVVDVYFSRARLVVEVDGFRAHSSPGSFARDRRRQNRLIEAGHQMLRFTWDDLAHRRQEVITTIRRLEERARI